MKKLTIIFCCLVIISCSSIQKRSSENLQLKFLDEFILPENIVINGTIVGGLSGIDYYEGTYYLVCDDSKNPRYYEAKIDINNSKINKVDIQKVILVKDTTHFLDLESIRYNAKTKQILITSEGHIKRQYDPSFFSVNKSGSIEQYFHLPKAFKANSEEKPRHNGVLEGLSLGVDKKGYWIAMELPLEVDGPEPQLIKTNSPVRITYVDATSHQPEKQFAYALDSITKQPKGNFAVNGLTDILEYTKDNFFIIERSYSSGLGTQGNTVKIFKATISKATNILEFSNLKGANYITATKELIFDFEKIRDQLTNNSVDNIEGITFGPTLPNGNRTLLLVSDNNFSKFEKQLNQFILLEILD